MAIKQWHPQILALWPGPVLHSVQDVRYPGNEGRNGPEMNQLKPFEKDS